VKSTITLIILSLFLQATPTLSIDRQPSPRLLKLANQPPRCPHLVKDWGDDEPGWCYQFKAIVDIDNGYLQVWKSDLEGNPYVVGKLKKGEVVYVRTVFKYQGRMRAGFTWLTSDCASAGCFGSVDLAYLR
jgi:hypothetical protein